MFHTTVAGVTTPAVPAGGGPWRPRFLAWLLAVCTLWSTLALRTAAAEARFSEAGLKAAYLLNFSNFVEWPTNRTAAGTSVTIGVLGRSDVATTLRDIVQRKAGSKRPLSVRELSSASEAVDCHIVYVGGTADADAVLRATAGLPVMTVGDREGFVERGGSVEFALVGDSIKFDVNQRLAEGVGLRISSKVLSLARRVVRTEGPKP